jgi:hypothetical protein
MNKNFIYTSNYVRNTIIPDSKKTATQIKTIQGYNPENTDEQKYITSKGLSGTSKVELDVQKPKITEPKKTERISRINIDSRHRNLESKNILDTQIYYLTANPIKIVSNNLNETDIIFNHPNHPFSVNDNIVVQGVQAETVVLENSITFIANSSFARINHKSHGLDFNSVNNINIEINGFFGNTNNNTDYNNIPINQINGPQRIYPVMSEVEINSKDYYYINMGSIIANFSDTYSLSSIVITYKDINGINLNLINANFPVSIFQLSGFQTINKITDNSYSIRLNINNNISVDSCGGNSIWVAKINDFIEGYINNNFYKISLKKTFYNVTKIKLRSTEFPNTEKLIKNIPFNKKNNAFYWKLQSDGDKIYSVELSPGNYSIDLLQTNLKKNIETVKRDTLTIINKNTSEYSYYENNKCNIVIEPKTDVFSIEFLTTIFIPKALTYKDSKNYTDLTGRLLINHPNHRLIANNIITIINATATDSIPQEVLNNSFVIEKIIDENIYQVKLPKYNISSANILVTNGGDSMGITFPVKAQLLFDKQDTIGNLIGYRNVGKPYSISNYSYINSNIDPYQYDTIDEELGYINNSINLSGDNYVLMSSPIFNDSYNTGLIDNIFAKLLLIGNPGSILYNQFIQLGETFSTPIPSFSEWEVSFYDADGDLFNFGNLEHSYTLEIYEEIKLIG